MASPHYASRQYRTNRALLLAPNPPCALCGLPGADSADHIIPTSKGGTAHLSNLRPTHLTCNQQRGNRAGGTYAAGW